MMEKHVCLYRLCGMGSVVDQLMDVVLSTSHHGSVSTYEHTVLVAFCYH